MDAKLSPFFHRYLNQPPDLINKLPCEIILNIVLNIPIDHFSPLLLTCRYWQKITWQAYCQKLFCSSDVLRHNTQTMTFTALKLAALLSSKETNGSLSYFIQMFNGMEAVAQLNFIRNLLRNLYDKPGHHPKLKELSVNLFNYPQVSVLCKMKIIDFEKSLNLNISPQFKFGVLYKNGLVPRKNLSFELQLVPIHFYKELCVHKKHSFQMGEIVAVVEKSSDYLGKSFLYFGRVIEKFNSLWRVALCVTANGKCSFITMKSSEEIGKFPTSSIALLGRIYNKQFISS